MKYKVGAVGFAALFASFFAFCGCKENCAKKIFFAGATQNAKVSPKADGAISDKFIFPAEGAVKFDGMLGKSLDTAMNGDILVWNTDELLRPYRGRYEKKPTDWQSEFAGKWLDGAELAYAYAPTAKLDKILKNMSGELIKTQKPDGSITTFVPAAEFSAVWDLWGRKYVMLALLSEYKRTADPKVLDALVKCADNIMANVGDGKRINNICLGWWYGLVSSSILEPFVGVYKYTGDKKYLDYAEWIVSCWATSNLKPDLLNKGLANMPVVKMFAPRKSVVKIYQDGGESKAYEMMSCYEGLIELYRATGNEDYKKAVLNTARQIAEREITAIGSGSIWERWVDGKFLQQEDSPYWMETCVSTTWIKLCAQLLRLSADPVYADYAELAAYNALAGAQGADGKWWSYFAPLKGARNPSPEQVKMHISCCVASGPRGLFILPKIAYTADSSDGLYVNFYENGEAKLEIPAFGASATLKVSEVDFGAEKLRAKIAVSLPDGKPQKFALNARIPLWSKNTEIFVNGKKSASPESGKYAEIRRKWRDGDTVEIVFDSRAFVVRDPNNPEIYALQRGPIVFAQDLRFEPNIDKPFKFEFENGDFVKNVEVVKINGTNAALKVKTADGGYRTFADYASCGATWDKNSRLRVFGGAF